MESIIAFLIKLYAKLLLKPAVQKFIDSTSRYLINLYLFFFQNPFLFLRYAISPPSGHKRPWLLVIFAVILLSSVNISYASVFHASQISIFKWVYLKTELIQIIPDSWDLVKLPFKSYLFGCLILNSICLGTISKIWKKIVVTGSMNYSMGLDNFCNWTVDAITKDTESVYIAATTPLIHIFYDNINSSDLSEYGGTDNTFESKFCEPFLKNLRNCKNSIKHLRFLYYSPDLLREKAKWVPIKDGANFAKYLENIRYFQEETVRAYARGFRDNLMDIKIKEAFRESHTLHMWIAIIKNKPNLLIPKENTVVLALTDQRNLRISGNGNSKNTENKKLAEKIAKNVMCIKCSTSNIVNFFEEIFEKQWDETEVNLEAILTLLRESRKGKSIDILLRHKYDSAVHGSLKSSGDPTHIIYSTT